jgi:Na+/phosphate symporter
VSEGSPGDQVSDARPTDVDTGFWLWLVAVPLMVTGYLVDLVSTQRPHPPAAVVVFSGLFVFIIAAVVVTFLFLMRQGYRWARTLLTGGGVASVVYTGTSLFSVDRSTTSAVIYAVSAIVGSVLIVGGVYLLHRKDAHAYFVR